MPLLHPYHVCINGVNYVCRIDEKSPFAREPQAPFVNRQSVATSRSEGDYGQDLVFTQTSWRNGEGQFRMTGGDEAMYYTSSDIDVSGSVAGLTLLKTTNSVSGGASQPDFGTNYVNIEAGYNALYASFPTNTGAGVAKQVWSYDGSAWTQISAGITGRDAQELYGMVFCKGYVFLVFNTGVARSDDYTVDWATENDMVAIATDGYQLFLSQRVTTAGYNYTHFYSGVPTAAAATALTPESNDLEGTPVLHGICQHAGTMYALSVIEGAEVTILYRYDSSNFVTWKILPDGFVGQSLCSDGSVLYITGKQKCAEGNYRGQIYYLTGTAATETLGQIATYGERDGTSDYTATSVRSHGKSIYFSWPFYGGIGRYDAINGGISRSYRQTTVSAEDNTITRIRHFNGTPYFLVKGTGANDTALWKVFTSDYRASGTLDSSFIDFGLPATQKLFKSITLIMPSAEEWLDEGATLNLYYAVDNDTTSWTSLGAVASPFDSDSNTYYRKRTFTVNTKAHNLAYRLVLSTDDEDSTITPKVTAVSVNAMTLLRSPGKTEPNQMWRFKVIVAKNIATEAGARIAADKSTLLSNLRNLHDAQTVATFESIDEMGTTYNAIVARISEVATSYSQKHGYEADVEVEVHEI